MGGGRGCGRRRRRRGDSCKLRAAERDIAVGGDAIYNK